MTEEERLKKKKQQQKQLKKKGQKQPKIKDVNHFTYNGSSLLDADTYIWSSLTKGLVLEGAIGTDGTIHEDLLIATTEFVLSVTVDGAWDLSTRKRTKKKKHLPEHEQAQKADEGFNAQFNAVTVPAPGALALLGFGLIGLAARRRTA